jgi:hypothetical protein
MKYTLPGDTWNMKTAKHILTEMKMFYNCPSRRTLIVSVPLIHENERFIFEQDH